MIFIRESRKQTVKTEKTNKKIQKLTQVNDAENETNHFLTIKLIARR